MAKGGNTEGQPEAAAAAKDGARRTRVFQSDIPKYTVQEALRIPEAIADNYAKAPTKPLHLAAAVEMTVNSGHFRMLLGASAAYGLTSGAWDSGVVTLTPLGKRVVEATTEADKRAALREAFLKPRVVGAFLSKYADAKLPKDAVAKQVLEELGLPADSAEQSLNLIVRGAGELGLLRDMKGGQYVDLDGTSTPSAAAHDHDGDEPDDAKDGSPTAARPGPADGDKVYITTGDNPALAEQLTELLTFGRFTPVVAADADAVPDDMRACSAAIIHVGGGAKLLDAEGREHVYLDQTVLLKVGAAMALYGRKFILLAERGAELPPPLQGLHEVRYEGGKLDYDATMKLLKAFNDFRQ